jgi:hypothetical protein
MFIIYEWLSWFISFEELAQPRKGSRANKFISVCTLCRNRGRCLFTCKCSRHGWSIIVQLVSNRLHGSVRVDQVIVVISSCCATGCLILRRPVARFDCVANI